jgi:hypothetical protein
LQHRVASLDEGRRQSRKRLLVTDAEAGKLVGQSFSALDEHEHVEFIEDTGLDRLE